MIQRITLSTLGVVALVATSACNSPIELPSADGAVDEQLLAAAVSFFQASRNDRGLYRDQLRFDGVPQGPSSIATTGMGLISLCVGDRMGLVENAGEQVKTTVRTFLAMGHARNATGFYYHFIDLETGARVWDSEYSTIDTAILVSGALFAASCLPGDAELDSLVTVFWESIDWSRAVADPAIGAIYLEMLDDGSGKPGSLIRPFNEYMLVAWLAKLVDRTGTGPATELWDRFYANADSLPTSDYAGYEVLTDRPGAFLSSFVIQFAYYLCHPFTVSEQYHDWLHNAQLADRAWWRQVAGGSDFEWGLGAGSAPSGYRADAIGNDPDHIVSPHVVAGFLPVDTSGLSDLAEHLARETRAVRTIDGVNGPLLWRYSLSNPSWEPEEIQGIDYSLMLLGLAAKVLGPSFFEQHNDFGTWLGGH